MNAKDKLLLDIKKLPFDICRKILSFILYNSNNINFIKYNYIIPNSNYSNRYEIAYINNKKLINNNNLLLSRISKKNGIYRYYSTTISTINTYTSCNDIRCYSSLCKKNTTFTLYKSNYICKNLNLALCVFHTLL
jgi:hypothetical protein